LTRPVLLINFKNYSEILGPGTLRLASAAQKAVEGLALELILAPPAPWLSAVASSASVPVFSQSVAEGSEGKSTGAIIPEALRGAGCRGSILNHSEAPLGEATLRSLVPRIRALGLASCVCGKDDQEVARLAALSPEYLAVEPPELIGSGTAVSRARPELLRDTVLAARSAGYRGSLLCGAGIVTGEDVRAAVGMGLEGVLVSSSVVKAKDWESKVRELASAML
jgi:triosephosphate isomerase